MAYIKELKTGVLAAIENKLLLFGETLHFTDQAIEHKDNADLSYGCILAIKEARYDDAEEIAKKAISFFPSSVEFYHNLGIIRHVQGQLDVAAAYFEVCILLNPYFDPAIDNLANVRLTQNNLKGALRAALKLEKVVPGLSDNAFRIGTIYLRRGKYKKANDWFDRGLNARIPQRLSRMLSYGTITAPRLKNDLEQIKYMKSQGILDPFYDEVIKQYERLLENSPQPKKKNDWTEDLDQALCSSDLLCIAPFYRRSLHIEPCDRVKDLAINPFNSKQKILDQWKQKKPYSFVVIDDFLNPEALKSLQAYYLKSTIWHNDSQKGRNYIGAYKEMGLYTPLMEQIIEEFKEGYGDIVKDHPLRELWAYRNVTGDHAIGAHADFSAVNLNIWITPNKANYSPESGGLIIYRSICPDKWDFDDYNGDQTQIEDFISGAEKYIIPYKENRAIIFNAALFHASDSVDFGSNYEDWRVNTTFLFGDRKTHKSY
ncbi:tetratricopeptide repeat protein [Flavivirga sp. 57AJ16]|uniref:tetratricopeptide repeat protein n=1 Tax=Flavivirga sp. 57AJ16 TaxID=3025307 RepID=UPI0023669345|nr:tetratricopeptide repeat protein [Flavivirga sp. 57AJ16]MDD7887912.1 tetratricopeptide repeat protein [Flavivirga sp. 57AJ16]